MDLKALEKKLRGTKTPFQKIIDFKEDSIIIIINEKKEVKVLTNCDRYKYPIKHCKLAPKTIRETRLRLSTVFEGAELEKALQEFIEENTIIQYTNIFPNIKQFMLMLNRLQEEQK